MKRLLLDTNAAAHCIFRRKGIDERVRAARRVGVRVGLALPVLGELFAGVEYSSTREKNLHILERNVRLFTLWPFTPAAAREYGRIFAELRREGRSIQQVDIQIAAIALTLANCTVVSSDSDFADIHGLSVENWIV